MAMQRTAGAAALTMLIGGCTQQHAMHTDRVELAAMNERQRSEPDQQPSAKRIEKNPDAHMAWPSESRDARVFDDAEAFAAASGGAPIVVDFDELQAGSDAAQLESPGVRFVANVAPLLVVRAEATRMPATYANVADPSPYVLRATTGEQILSPGGVVLAPGPNPTVEDDDVSLVFDPPVAAVGFDVLFASADSMSFTDVTVVDVDGHVLYTGSVTMQCAETVPNGFAGPGSAFWGFVADECVIAEVRIDERDDNAECPDANIGLDSLRFAPTAHWRAYDIDGNGRFDPFDIDAFLTLWHTPAIAEESTPTWRHGDINLDHAVNERDLNLLLLRLDWPGE